MFFFVARFRTWFSGAVKDGIRSVRAKPCKVSATVIIFGIFIFLAHLVISASYCKLVNSIRARGSNNRREFLGKVVAPDGPLSCETDSWTLLGAPGKAGADELAAIEKFLKG